jgi:hypothetical protein
MPLMKSFDKRNNNPAWNVGLFLGMALFGLFSEISEIFYKRALRPSENLELFLVILTFFLFACISFLAEKKFRNPDIKISVRWLMTVVAITALLYGLFWIY